MIQSVRTLIIAGSIDSSIHESLVDLGNCPRRVSIETMVWRLSNTMIGREVLDQYASAMKHTELWHETAALLLQNLSRLFRVTRLCASSSDYASIDRTLMQRDTTRLSEQIENLTIICARNRYSVKSLLSYIEECRNIYVHSGVLPYSISDEKTSTCIDDFLRSRLEVDFVELSFTTLNGSSPFPTEDINERYQILCSLILSALAIIFDSSNPSLSKYVPFRYLCLYTSMVWHTIRVACSTIFLLVSAAIYGSLSLVRFLFSACIVGVIAIIVLVLASKVIGFFGDHPRYQLIDVDPKHLVELVDKMTPYQQMTFLKNRKSSLAACGILYKVGDTLKSPADSVTLRLYEQFKDYPDPSTHTVGYMMPNSEHLSAVPAYSWLFSGQLGGEKLFSRFKTKEDYIPIPYMPIYSGGWYPVLKINGANYDTDLVGSYGKNIARNPNLKVLLLYGSGSKNNSGVELAKKVKNNLLRAGVNARRITVMEDKTSRGSGVVVTIGGIRSK